MFSEEYIQEWLRRSSGVRGRSQLYLALGRTSEGFAWALGDQVAGAMGTKMPLGYIIPKYSSASVSLCSGSLQCFFS